MPTIKCPFCAERIQHRALVCKHCHKELPTKKKKSLVERMNEAAEQQRIQAESMRAHQEQMRVEEEKKIASMSEDERKEYFAKLERDKARSDYQNKLVLFWAAILILAALIAAFGGYLALLAVLGGLWLHPLQNEKIFQNRLVNYKKHKIRSAASVLLVILMIVGLGFQISDNIQKNAQHQKELQQQAENEAKKLAEAKAYAAAPEPKITLISKEGEQGKASEYELKFSVTDADKVLVNDEEVKAEDGVYSQKIMLTNASNSIHIEASNAYKKGYRSLTVSREKTAAELQAEAKKQAQEEREKMEDNPTDYITMVKDNWYKVGSIPVHSITLKNTSKVNYANISIAISYYTNSDSFISTEYYVIKDNLPTGSTKTFRDINMGFVDAQIGKASVEIQSASVKD